MIKFIVEAGEVMVFLLLIVGGGYLCLLAVRLWDKYRERSRSR